MQYVVLGVTTIVVDIIVMIGYATLVSTRIAGWIKGPKVAESVKQSVWLAVYADRRLVSLGTACLMKVPEALALIRPGRNLTRNNQVDTEARKQRTGKTINPLRQTLIATTHFRQCKQAGDYGKPRQRFHDDQGKDPPACARSHVIANEQ